VKVGDLVKLKHRGNGHPRVGIIYERAAGHDLGPGRTDEFRCLWDEPYWNNSFYFERELVVISESR
jgi:hypothetical protein